MAVNPDKNGVEQSLIARLIGKIKRIVLDINGAVSAEETRATAAEAAAKTEVVQGENCTIEKTTAADGHDVYTINADGKPQVQADWSQADSSAVDYIKNKPNLALKENVANKSQSIDPTSTTEYGSSKAVADFVNSSVATNTANFLGSFTLTDLSLTYPATDVQIAAALNSHTWPSGVTPTNNDYVYVEIQNPQTTGVDDKVERFKYSGLLESWGYEYTLNNSSFTAAEMATLESGITASDKTNWNNHVSNTSNPHDVTAAQIGAEPAFSVLPIAKGGTGAGSANEAVYNLFNDISTFYGAPNDDSLIPFKLGTPSAASGFFFLRRASYLWTYIQNKISSVLGLTATEYGGNAATASAAASGSALESAINAKQGTVSTDTDSSAFDDNTAIATGFSSNKLHLNLASRLWNYIRGKILGWYDWTRVDSGTGRYAKICSIADPASGTSYTVDVLVTHMTSYYAVTGLVRITVSHGSSSVQASILASDSLFYAVDSGNPPKVYTYVDGTGKYTFVFDTASAYQTAQGFVFRAVGGFSDKWSFFGDVGCSNDAADLGSIGTKQNTLDVTFVFATYAKTAGYAETATNYASSGGIADALAGKSSTNHAHDDRYVLFDTNSQGLTDTQKSNARTNIGAGTSSLTLGINTYEAARGNHAHGLLDRDGYLSDQSWAVSNADRLVIAKSNYNGKVGYLVPSALLFDSDEKNKALTQSAEWKEFLQPNGNGSGVSVTPDGTSTGTDIGNSTTLNVWAQKFKNLVSGLGRAAYKNTPMSGYNASSSEVVMGNDTRLTDARTPTAHNHDTLYLKSPSSQTLQWGGSIVIGTYNGNNITLTMPANPFDPNGDYSSNTLRANTAVSADSAQYAVGASNYATDGNIYSRFTSIDSTINKILTFGLDGIFGKILTFSGTAGSFDFDSKKTAGVHIFNLNTAVSGGPAAGHQVLIVLPNATANRVWQISLAYGLLARKWNGSSWSSWKTILSAF